LIRYSKEAAHPKGNEMIKSQREVIGPKSRKQEMFIKSDADVVCFGGAASSGKSHLGVMDFLQHVHHKGFRGVISRRTTTMLKSSGGILDKCLQLFPKIDPKVKWKSQDNKFVFSSGAEIYLRHFEYFKDHVNWQGTEYTEILCDEGTQFEEEMVLYCMSRLRNPNCPVKPRLRITCNPDKNSYLRKWVDWYIDEDGYPIEERCGVKRYFIRRDNTFIWGDTREEIIEKYKVDPKIVLSFTFINATVKDNPVVLENNPEYVGWLESLGRVEKARLLFGNWNVSSEATGYWKKEWCEIVDKPPLDAIKVARAWDISGSLPSELMPNPDWTAGVRISKDRYGTYYIEDVVRFRARHGEVFERMVEAAKQDGDDTLIVVPADPGASGKQYASTLIRDLAERGFYAKSKPTSKSKVQRFAPFCAACESGNVKIVAGEWNDTFIDELEAFDGSRRVKDD
jgi:predicted phage terminase large subunit-like protein